NGGIGMHDANTTNEDGGHWKQVAYDKAGEHTLEVTILEMTGDDGSPYLSTNGSVQLWWPNADAGYDVELFVDVTAEIVSNETDDSGTADDGTVSDGDAGNNDETVPIAVGFDEVLSAEGTVKTVQNSSLGVTDKGGWYNGDCTWVDSFSNMNFTDNSYVIVDYVGSVAPMVVIQGANGEWVENDALYVSGTSAVYSYAVMADKYGDVSTATGVQIKAAYSENGAITISGVKVIEYAAAVEKAIIALEGTNYLAAETTIASWDKTQINTKHEGTGTMDTSTWTSNTYILMDYEAESQPKMIIGGEKGGWVEIPVCFILDGVAVYSYDDIVATYGTTEDIYQIYIQATNKAATIKSVKVVEYSGN
ncbi:MAG: hypothetical protein IJ379_07810, partial [Lachnospiraceae bacterium]|nr:hypothetical protein [Lachnospiraceae bacterium]